jgi:hypothetical protein
MKIYYFLLILALFELVGCSEDFLDLNPPSNPNVDVLYNTDADFEQAVNGIYDQMQDTYQYLWQFTELRADNGDHLWTGYLSVQRVDQFRLDPTDDILNNLWSDLYNALFRANITLQKLENADPEIVINKDRHEGEAKFLRALSYYHLVQIYGEVPLILEPVSTEESYTLSQSPVSEIYNQIIKDFMDAENLLPEKYTDINVGRATNGAAKTMLGKTYLVLKEYVKAEEKLSEVMNMHYKLLPDYNSVFDHMNEHHEEYIFDIEFEPDLGTEGSTFTFRFIPNHPQLRSFYGIAGGSGEQLSPSSEFMSLFEPGDDRIYITADTGFVQENGEFFKTNHSYTRKYISPTTAQNDSRVNWRVTRFADVILMYAEALNENGKTEQAVDELNKIRMRANASPYDDLSQEEARDAIALERRLELAFEGHRWYDLLRTNKAISEMSSKGYDIKPHMTVFPKPQQQLDVINDPALFSQNTGY